MNKKNIKILWIVVIIIVGIFLLRSYAPEFFAISQIPGGGTCSFDDNGMGYSQALNVNSFTCQYEKCVINAKIVVDKPLTTDSDRRVFVRKGKIGDTLGPESAHLTPLYFDVNKDGILEGYDCTECPSGGCGYSNCGPFPQNPGNAFNPGWFFAVGDPYKPVLIPSEMWITSNISNAKLCPAGGGGATFECTARGDSISSTPTRNCDGITEHCTTDLIYTARYYLCPPPGEVQTFCPGILYNSTTVGTLSQTYYSGDIKLNAGETVTFNPQYITGEPIIDKMLYIKNCKSTFLQILSTKTQYNYGDTITIPIKLSKDGVPQEGVKVDGSIEVDGVPKSIATSTTDSNGNANLIFNSVEVDGNANLIVYSTIGSEPAKTQPLLLTFGGKILSFNVTTSSNTQSNLNPIVFSVKITDTAYGSVASESITNKQVIATLSNGNIGNSNVVYSGNGLFIVSTTVTGTGSFVGKLAFDYKGKHYESDSIQITVSSAEGKRCNGKQPQILENAVWKNFGPECSISCNPLDYTCTLESGCTEHSETGACSISGLINTYTCKNTNELWFVNANGQASKVDTCGLVDNSFCSEGIGYCRYCIEQQYICGNNELDKCVDETSASGIVKLLDCEAGCVKSASQTYCDSLLISAPDQNFFSSEEVVVHLQLTGSQSGMGKQTDCSATLTGGIEKTLSCTSDVNGNININFGKQPIGLYNTKVILNNYPEKVINIKSTVTNQFKIRISGTQILTKIPGKITSTQIEALDSKGTAPDNVIITSNPQNIIATTSPTTLNGKWNLNLEGDLGIYTIGLSAVKQDVTLPEQTIEVEIRKPILHLSSNVPLSVKSGKQTYDLFVSGPTGASTNENLKPDSISASIGTKNVTLLDLGSGHYTFEYLFEAGTYSLIASTSKAGYDSANYSYTFEVSSSGTSVPTTNVGNDTTTINVGAEQPKGIIGGITITQIIIGVLVLVVIFLLFRRRRK